MIELKTLRSVLSTEGITLLILFFVAMPLKYFAGYPQAVFIAGIIHGFLFSVATLLLVKAWKNELLTFWEFTQFFFISLLPFGSFYACRKIDTMIDGWERSTFL